LQPSLKLKQQLEFFLLQQLWLTQQRQPFALMLVIWQHQQQL